MRLGPDRAREPAGPLPVYPTDVARRPARVQMAAALPQEHQIDPDLLEAYQEYLRTLRLRQTKFGYILPVALVPAALSLDWFVYPELFKPILASRIWCNLVLTPCWILAFTPYARRLL